MDVCALALLVLVLVAISRSRRPAGGVHVVEQVEMPDGWVPPCAALTCQREHAPGRYHSEV